MKRLYLALVLLLMSFLSTLDSPKWAQDLANLAGPWRWVPQALLAAIAVGVFVRVCSVHRRLLFPRRGLRLLAVGLVVYALGVAVATGVLASGAGLLAVEPGTPLASLPGLVELLSPQPLFLGGLLLLAVGAFRALTNLVSPSEFAEDY